MRAGGGRLREKKGKTEGNRRQEGAPAMSTAVSKQDSIDICQERWSHMGTSWSQTSELVLHGILALLFVVVLFFFSQPVFRVAQKLYKVESLWLCHVQAKA